MAARPVAIGPPTRHRSLQTIQIISSLLRLIGLGLYYDDPVMMADSSKTRIWGRLMVSCFFCMLVGDCGFRFLIRRPYRTLKRWRFGLRMIGRLLVFLSLSNFYPFMLISVEMFWGLLAMILLFSVLTLTLTHSIFCIWWGLGEKMKLHETGRQTYNRIFGSRRSIQKNILAYSRHKRWNLLSFIHSQQQTKSSYLKMSQYGYMQFTHSQRMTKEY